MKPQQHMKPMTIDETAARIEKARIGPPRQVTGPPRSGAGVGVGMLRGAGIPLLENKKGFLVSWFLDFGLWFLAVVGLLFVGCWCLVFGFLVSWFRSF